MKFRTTNRIKLAFSANSPLATYKSKMCKQNAIIKFALQIVRIAPKCPLQYVNFQKFSGGACPRTSLKSFLFPYLLQIQLCQKKGTLKKCQNLVLKSSKYRTTTFSFTWTHFLKNAYLRSFSGLTSLRSLNIQPNSKLHPPHQNFLDPPLNPWSVKSDTVLTTFRQRCDLSSELSRGDGPATRNTIWRNTASIMKI